MNVLCRGIRALPPTGFTLIELLLALALSSLVGLTVLIMLNGMIVGTQTRFDTRRATLQRQVASARLAAQTRSARMLLASGSQHLVLWIGDSVQNGQPNLSELRRVEWDPDQSEVYVYEAPDDLDPALDSTFEFSDDFSAVTSAVAGSSTFPGRVVLQDISDWESAIDSGQAQSARLMRLRVTICNESGDDIATIVSALRLQTD